MKKPPKKTRGWVERTTRDDFIVRIYGWGKLKYFVRGYAVRFPDSYKVPHRYFAVVKHGGHDATLKVARAHRDAMLKTLNPPPRRHGVGRKTAAFDLVVRKSNKSGVTGIAFDKRGYWVAYGHPKVSGKQVRKAYGVKRYTHDGAKMLAMMWRAEHVKKLRRQR